MSSRQPVIEDDVACFPGRLFFCLSDECGGDHWCILASMEKNKLVIVIYRMDNGAFALRTAFQHEVCEWHSDDVDLFGKNCQAWIAPEDYQEYSDRIRLNILAEK